MAKLFQNVSTEVGQQIDKAKIPVTGVTTFGRQKGATFNPLDYGDSATAALQAALDSLEFKEDGVTHAGGTLQILDGFYVIGSTIRVPRFTHIKASLKGSQFTWSGSDHADNYMFTMQFNSSLEGVRIVGVQNSTNSNGILIGNAYVTLRDIEVEDVKHAIKAVTVAPASSAHYGRMDNISIKNCSGVGIFIAAGGFDYQMSKIWIGQCGTGIRFEDGQLLGSEFHIWGCTGSGLILRGTYFFLNGGYIETNAVKGIDAYNSRYISLHGVRIWKNGLSTAPGAGAFIDSCEDVHISNCMFTDNYGIALKFASTKAFTVAQCSFRDTRAVKGTTKALEITGTSTNWSIDSSYAPSNECTIESKSITATPTNGVVGAGWNETPSAL